MAWAKLLFENEGAWWYLAIEFSYSSTSFFMHLYQLIHTIKSPKTKRILENYISSQAVIISLESEVGWHCYEIETTIHKKQFIKLLGSFIKELPITKDERVVLYDPKLQSEIFELPGKNEKILFNGDIEKENLVEEIVLMVFRHIKMKMVLEEKEKEYFDSLTNDTHLN
ncbi:MAG: hypothetical protein HY951_03370 [Bacteroidia bacterium]|nr:hypothetical protein [Bacteroidia bacterium]